MRRPILSLVFALGCGLGQAACGGSHDGPPPPLGRHFQDSFIAAIPIDQQQEVVKAQSAFNIAQREQAKAEADLREASLTVDVARNEAKSAKLDEESAKSRMKMAQQSADQNRINDATKEQRGAELAHNAADERVHYYSEYREWLKKLLRYTQENTYWREAQYELAKAKLAKTNNIAPPGFNYENYTKQEEDRAKRAAASKSKTDDAHSKAMDARNRWVAVQGEADKTLGKKSEFPDPMSPHEVVGTDVTAGAGGTTVGGNSNQSDQQVQPTQDPTKHDGAGSGSAAGSGSGSGSGGQ